MKKLITKFLLAVCVLCFADAVFGASISWNAPSSVKVGQTFTVTAYYGSTRCSVVYVDSSRSTGGVSSTDYAYQWKATKAGTVTFFVQYDVGAQRYTEYKSVTIVADTPPTPPSPKLGSVSISVSSTSVAPGESVTCPLSAYSTTGTSITGGTKSWSISSVTNDTISVSGVVTVDPALVPRIISITGKYTYDGVTKSGTKTVEVVPLVVPVPVITPEDGTIIGESQSVLLSCEDEDAQIYYTTDGSEPTVESALYETRFRVSGKAMVKAVAVHDGRLDSEVAVAHYALGQCPDPVIVSAGGETFLQKGNQVSIDWECADGVLRYTTDGSDVTETSPEYAGVFTIDETTTIKAKAFGETYFDSQQVEMTIRYLMHTITFDSCGGSEVASLLLQEGLAYGELPTPARVECAFLGWYTAAEGGDPITSTLVVSKDQILYAHWLELSHDMSVLRATVFSGNPWQEFVIGYAISGSANGSVGLRMIVSENETGAAWTNVTYEAAALKEGWHQFKWKEAKVSSTNLEVEIQLFDPTYCVIDLSGGVSDVSYPVTYLGDVPDGGWTDEFKTTKLVLRRIGPGTYMHGENEVRVTKPYYIGVFEVTQKQYELVMGSNPSSTKGETCPVDVVSYNMIRGASKGAKWPTNNSVDSSSFLGKLRAKTGIDFDIPTQVQWIYACRAGTTTDYNNGGSTEGDLKLIGRYIGNWNDGKGGYSESYTKVGMYLPNAFGLYDMHGNVWEWCLDWSGGAATDEAGPSTGSRRRRHGGAAGDDASKCTWSYAYNTTPSSEYGNVGFRLAMPLQNDEVQSSIADRTLAFSTVSSGMVSVDNTFVEGANVDIPFLVAYGYAGSSECALFVDGAELMSPTEPGVMKWRPNSVGEHILVWTSDELAMTSRVNVASIEAAKPIIEPSDGTIIGDTQSVLISCEDEDAQIHYTLDGSEPTAESPMYQRRFRVSGKTTVKAIAVFEGWTNSEVAVAHYALGQCPDPMIVSAGGEIFSHGSVQVSVDWECADGVLRYTTDGSDVTETSPEYAGAFAIDDTTTIKAKAFGETYFDSKQVELTVTREWAPVSTPIIAAAESFSGRKTMVSISCATEGATIRYTVDGSEPNSESTLYSGVFEVRESTVVKAFAMLADYVNSEVATKTITKVWGIGDSVGLPDHAFTTDGDAEWVNDGDVAMRSGKITHKQTSVLRSTFVGKGRLTFELKTSCEEDLPEYMEYDRAEVWMNGVLKMKQDGVHDWMPFEFDLDGASTTVEWRYVKDAMDDAKYPGEDCIWVRNIVWLPELTCTTEVPVELRWIREKFGDLGNYYYDYEEKARETAANGHKVWECYVTGEDPTDKDSRFTATIKMGADGKPIVSWKPPLNGEDADGAGIREGVRSYSVYGKQTLGDAAEEWTPVAEGDEGNYRFFKVGVGIPEK